MLHYLLRQVFGFKRVFDVYSGRRGAHTWCYDKRCINWTSAQRATFMERIMCKKMLDISDDISDHIYYNILLPIFKQSPVLFARDPSCSRQIVFDSLYPKFDKRVTMDARHLKVSIVYSVTVKILPRITFLTIYIFRECPSQFIIKRASFASCCQCWVQKLILT